jgi:hypothetical protein
MPPTPSVRASLPRLPNNGVRPSWKTVPEKVFGWVVTVTTPDPAGATAKVWYAACPKKVDAVEAVKLVTHNSSASIEISREMSKTLMTAFGLTTGQVKCFD